MRSAERNVGKRAVVGELAHEVLVGLAHEHNRVVNAPGKHVPVTRVGLRPAATALQVVEGVHGERRVLPIVLVVYVLAFVDVAGRDLKALANDADRHCGDGVYGRRGLVVRVEFVVSVGDRVGDTS